MILVDLSTTPTLLPSYPPTPHPRNSLPSLSPEPHYNDRGTNYNDSHNTSNEDTTSPLPTPISSPVGAMPIIPDYVDTSPKAAGRGVGTGTGTVPRLSAALPTSSVTTPGLSGGGTPNPLPLSTATLRDAEFEGIQEMSDAEFASSTRKRRSSPRIIRSSLRSSAPTSDIDHIDISGQSSPPMTRRSPIRQPSSPTQTSGWRRNRIPDSEDDSDPEPAPKKRVSRVSRVTRTILSDDDDGDDDDEVLVPSTRRSPRKATPAATRAMPRAVSRAISVDSNGGAESFDEASYEPDRKRPNKGKGKARPPSYEQDDPYVVSDDDGFEQSGATENTTMDYDDDGDLDYGDDDFNYSAVPFPDDGFGLPNFDALPSSIRRRSPPPPIEIFDSEDDGANDISVVSALPFLKKPKTRKTREECEDVKFDDITLLPELDQRLREFYINHWKRGADQEGEESGDDDEDDFITARKGRGRSGMSNRAFTVAAPAAEAKKAAAFRGRGRSWRGRGRGRK